MTSAPGRAGRDSEQLLAEALRAKAGGPKQSRSPAGGSHPGAAPGGLTMLQLILASLIAGLVVGILAAVLTLI